MSRIRRDPLPRKNIRIPEPLIDEVDQIVRENRLYFSRQQFIESAIREKIEELRLLLKRS